MIEINIPNFLTLSRLFFVPFIIFTLVRGNFYVSFALLAFALVSDLLDGLVARRTDTITTSGQVLDPLADKTLFLSLLGYFTYSGEVPLGFFIAILVPHLALLVGGGISYGNEGWVIPSNYWGKGGSMALAAALTMIYFDLPFYGPVLYLALSLTYISASIYFFLGCKKKFHPAESGEG